MESAESNNFDVGQAFSSEMIGLMILNELKYFRSELTNEVKNLAKKLDMIASCTKDDQQFNCKSGLPFRLPRAGQSDNVFQTTGLDETTLKAGTDRFVEFSPETDNNILNNHIAFRMSESFPHTPNVEFPQIQNETETNDYISEDIGIAENSTEVFGPSSSKAPPLHWSAYDEDSQQVRKENLQTVLKQNKLSTQKQTIALDKRKVKYNIVYKCTACVEQFDSSDAYNEHYRAVHREKEDLKETAVRSFWEDRTVKHIFEHPQPKQTFCCTICSRQFSTKSSLLRHSVLHSGVKKYVCKLCGQRFFRSDHLKSHLPTHSRRKHYQCIKCKKYFARPQCLANHMKIHEAVPELLGSIPEQISSFTPSAPQIDYLPGSLDKDEIRVKAETSNVL